MLGILSCPEPSRVRKGVVWPPNNDRLLVASGVRKSSLSIAASAGAALDLLGVRCICAWSATPASPMEREGVPASRSKSPSTRPSFCGVGPMEVGAVGVNSFLLREGVVAAVMSWLSC